MGKTIRYEMEVDFYENSVSGSTVNAYVTVVDLDVRGLEAITINIKNTDGANALKYQTLLRYANYASGTNVTDWQDIVVVAGDESPVLYEHGYARIIVQVASNVGGAHATYEVEYVLS